MDIFEIVREHIGRQFERDTESIGNDTTFEELGADSLDIIDLIAEIESELETEVSDEKLNTIKNVGDVVRIFEETV